MVVRRGIEQQDPAGTQKPGHGVMAPGAKEEKGTAKSGVSRDHGDETGPKRRNAPRTRDD